MENKSLQESNTQAGAPKIKARPDSCLRLSSPPLYISSYHYLRVHKDKEVTLASWISDTNYEGEEEEKVSWKQTYHEISEV